MMRDIAIVLLVFAVQTSNAREKASRMGDALYSLGSWRDTLANRLVQHCAKGERQGLDCTDLDDTVLGKSSHFATHPKSLIPLRSSPFGVHPQLAQVSQRGNQLFVVSAMAPSRVPMESGVALETEAFAKKVDTFIWTNELNERTAKLFKELPRELQAGIMTDPGAFSESKSLSKEIEAFVRYARSEQEVGVASVEEVEDFLQANNIDDDRPANLLRRMSPELQAKVLAEGDLSTARNPNAVLMRRIGDAKSRAAVEPASAKDVAEFMRAHKNHKLEDWAAQKFKETAPELQAKVIAQGNLSPKGNPTKELLNRIRRERSRAKILDWRATTAAR